MRIGIDISQVVYEGTGVARYVREFVTVLAKLGRNHEFVLFGSSLRKHEVLESFVAEITKNHTNFSAKLFRFPPSLLDIVWNRLHIFPIEWLIGSVDVFWSSDWMQPPLAKAFGITTIHDLAFKRYPETFHRQIIEVQARRLACAKKECLLYLCDSLATKNDAHVFLGIPVEKLMVVYPGFSYI